MGDYTQFLINKQLVAPSCGIDVPLEQLNPAMFEWQKLLVKWALKKGRAAIFANTGLGKTVMQLEYAKWAADRTLILAPLTVAKQTIKEGAKFGYTVTYARSQDQASETGITITNYEMVKHFDLSEFGAVVLDESSILKSFDGKVRTQLIEICKVVPMRLCCTATPAPNDISEIANHTEFLGIMTRTEMLASFFIHDDEGWRLKGHGRSKFYKWLASWGMSVRMPSDLGYSDEGYDLPGLEIKQALVETDYVPEGQLFAVGLKGIGDRSKARKASVEDRVARATAIIQSQPDEQWIAWVGRNDESSLLTKALGSIAVEVEGSQSPDEKTARLEQFISGEKKVLVIKPSIGGFGLNLQFCARMIFVGLSDSYEQYYQAIRRCYRFGQTRVVEAHIVLSELEDTIFQNVLRKEKEATVMAAELIKHVREFEKAEILQGGRERMDYTTTEVTGNGWKLMLGDSAERMQELEDESVDLSVFSEPFASLFTYSNSERDLGNCKSYDEFWQQFSYITSQLYRVMKPGRIVAAHVQQLPLTKQTDGVIGVKDFRGDNIRHFVEQGFIYHGEICIDKDPQAQAIRTKNKGLLFVQLHKDSSWSRPAFADYILLFRKPGENKEPVIPDVNNEEWIQWARPIWYGIKESDTLNAAEARSSDDERHICPLQLGTIERIIRLYSNKGNTVFTPFLGIGSEVYQAVKLGREGIGIELNPNYFKVATRNVAEAERLSQQQDLFSQAGIAV